MINSPLRGVPNRDYRITQTFGKNPHIYAQFGMKGHNGIDFAPLIPGTTNQKVQAPHEGYVRVGFDKDGYGNFVEIVSLPYNHDGDQRFSVLAHFQTITVQDGQFVSMGDDIGIMGSTGFSDGIHCHWTYKRRRNGVTQDKDNGFKGAIDVGQYTAVWLKQPLT